MLLLLRNWLHYVSVSLLTACMPAQLSLLTKAGNVSQEHSCESHKRPACVQVSPLQSWAAL